MNESTLQLLAKLEEFNRLGAVLIMKIDGVRILEGNDNIYTVILSGGEISNGDFFRKDGASLNGLLGKAIDFYLENRGNGCAIG